jgi:hypothetical protein
MSFTIKPVDNGVPEEITPEEIIIQLVQKTSFGEIAPKGGNPYPLIYLYFFVSFAYKKSEYDKKEQKYFLPCSFLVGMFNSSSLK